ncbi:general transcription and DNA repair factor IIH helicase subunit XPB1 [Tanacetum coccineum]
MGFCMQEEPYFGEQSGNGVSMNTVEAKKGRFIANVDCTEVWCPMTKHFLSEYLKKQNYKRKQALSLMNPNKIRACEYLIRLHEERGDKIVVFTDSLYVLTEYAMKLHKPMIFNASSHVERAKKLEAFKTSKEVNTVFISDFGDNFIGIPEANVIIQISSHAGSRHQESQPFRHILKAKGCLQDRILFYSLVSTDTKEMQDSIKRQQFLINQVLSCKVITSIPAIPDTWSELSYQRLKDQLCLLDNVLTASDSELGMEILEDDTYDIHGQNGSSTQSKPMDRAMRHKMFMKRLIYATLLYLAFVELQHLEMEAEAKRASLDSISNIPSTIIENILCLVPIKDAVTTSILSRKWRYNWVKIPKLVFNEKDMFNKTALENQQSILEQSFRHLPSERKQLTRKCKLFYAIHQVLLLHQGPILEFSLSMIDADVTCVEIDQIITHLARNNNPVKKLALVSESRYFLYKFPLSTFSLHQLTDLNVKNCSFNLNPTFSGFGSLTRLYFESINVSKEALLHLLSSCPLLKSLELVLDFESVDEEIPIIELFKCLPVIEYLSIFRFHYDIEFKFDNVPSELPNELVHLKSFCVNVMRPVDVHWLQILGLVMRISPNLEKIKIQIEHIFHDEDEQKFVTLEECPDIWLEHLKELEIVNFANFKGEMEFVKFILAKSPVLKKVIIWLDTSCVTKDEELKILKVLLACPRVSP